MASRDALPPGELPDAGVNARPVRCLVVAVAVIVAGCTSDATTSTTEPSHEYDDLDLHDARDRARADDRTRVVDRDRSSSVTANPPTTARTAATCPTSFDNGLLGLNQDPTGLEDEFVARRRARWSAATTRSCPERTSTCSARRSWTATPWARLAATMNRITDDQLIPHSCGGQRRYRPASRSSCSR